MNSNRLEYGLICEKWGREEEAWVNLFVENYTQDDKIVLNIYLMQNNGLDKNYVTANVRSKISRHKRPVKLNMVEIDDLYAISSDYWLLNTFYEKNQNNFQSSFGTIETCNLKDLEKTYTSVIQSRNAYEYDHLVDSYDFEKKGAGFVESEYGLIPTKFGSSGGENFKQILGFLTKYCSQDARILEVGCGAGAFFKTLKINQRNYFYNGVDNSRRQIIRCRENYPEGEFKVANALALPMQSNYYDFVFENNVLIFITDPLKAMDEMCRVTRFFAYFTVHIVNEKNGLYGYYPFSSIHKLDPQTNTIYVAPEEKRFFPKEGFHVRRIAKDKVIVCTTKVPTYVPGIFEFEKFIKEMNTKYSLDIEWEKQKPFEKELIVDPKKSPDDIINDDCVITEDDQMIKLNSISISLLIKKKHSNG